MMRRSYLLPLLLVLSGCSATLPTFSWQQNDRSGESSARTPSSPASRTQPTLFSWDLPVKKSRPVLHELKPSRVAAATSAALAACVDRLQLPREIEERADQSNYGKRLNRDAWGRSISAKPQLIVLHETVISEKQTIDLFKTAHPDDSQQASYHLLIGRDGRRIRIVPDAQRAFGAGMSAFGDATQRTKPGSVGSINNISLHVSLVSPVDGRDDRDSHAGYTDAQYRTLAGQVLLWQARYGIPFSRVTTHAAVDRSRSRYDPRSFNWDKFKNYYNQFSTVCGFAYLDNGQAAI